MLITDLIYTLLNLIPGPGYPYTKEKWFLKGTVKEKLNGV